MSYRILKLIYLSLVGKWMQIYTQNNLSKKSDYIVRNLHHIGLKMKLMDEFGPHLPPTTDFEIGYFPERQSTKYWLTCQEDLNNMNKCAEKTKRNYDVMVQCKVSS